MRFWRGGCRRSWVVRLPFMDVPGVLLGAGERCEEKEVGLDIQGGGEGWGFRDAVDERQEEKRDGEGQTGDSERSGRYEKLEKVAGGVVEADEISGGTRILERVATRAEVVSTKLLIIVMSRASVILNNTSPDPAPWSVGFTPTSTTCDKLSVAQRCGEGNLKRELSGHTLRHRYRPGSGDAGRAGRSSFNNHHERDKGKLQLKDSP